MMTARWIWTMTCMLSLALGASAQERRKGDNPPPEGAGEQARMRAFMERFHKSVMELATEEQKPKLQAVFDKLRERGQALREEMEKGVDERHAAREKLRAAFEEMKNELNAILTPEQREKLAASMPQQMRPGAIMEKFQAAIRKIDLSDEQRNKLQLLGADLAPKFDELKQQAQTNREAAGEKMRELFTEFRERVGEILTPEQKAQLQELMKQDAPPQPGEKNGKQGGKRPKQ